MFRKKLFSYYRANKQRKYFISTLVRFIKKMSERKLVSIRLPKKSYISNRSWKACLKFAIKYLSWNLDQRKHGLWAEESKYSMFGRLVLIEFGM